MIQRWKQLGGPVKIGLVLGLIGALLTVIGLLMGNLAPLTARSSKATLMLRLSLPALPVPRHRWQNRTSSPLSPQCLPVPSIFPPQFGGTLQAKTKGKGRYKWTRGIGERDPWSRAPWWRPSSFYV
jgi:hypothetical protein